MGSTTMPFPLETAKEQTELKLRDALGDRLQSLLRRHGRKLWWVHSLYALSFGASVVFFAQKGFDNARWLSASVIAVWLLVLVFFRVFGRTDEGPQEREVLPPTTTAGAKAKLRFFVMTYVLKNLYQGMLFFLLPFYWKSSTFGAWNFLFVMLLGLCAVVSTLDIVFDRFVLRRRVFASAFHAVTLFACLNLVIPALFPSTRTLYSLLTAAAITVVGFFSLHARADDLLSVRNLAILVLGGAAGVTGAYYAREAVPPVPMHLSAAAVGPSVLEDGRLAMEVKTLHASVIHQLLAVTDVVVPGGQGEALFHVWRHDGHEVRSAIRDTAHLGGPFGTVRLRSKLSGHELPKNLAGEWMVEVRTEDGQLVGRTSFIVMD